MNFLSWITETSAAVVRDQGTVWIAVASREVQDYRVKKVTFDLIQK